MKPRVSAFARIFRLKAEATNSHMEDLVASGFRRKSGSRARAV
jgi:hypothetical protein